MSRVVNTNSPGKRRNQHMRAGAELLRRLSQKPAIDDEARDMMAALVYSLRGVEESLEDATDAWEKRDYWMKAEQFRQKWMWVGTSADELDAILWAEDWGRLPVFMINILPNYAEITINKFTRDSDLWDGMYKRFQAERSR